MGRYRCALDTLEIWRWPGETLVVPWPCLEHVRQWNPNCNAAGWW